MGVRRPARTRTGLVVMAEARRAATVPPALPPPRGCAALNVSSEGRALGACGQVGARVDTATRMWPSLPSPGGACRPPVSCEQGREESELGRPGDGWELLVGGPPLQQEQGKCPRRVAGAPWPRVCGTGAVGELSPAPPLAQDPQAGSKASEPRGTHWLPGPSPGHWAPSSPFLGHLEGLCYHPRVLFISFPWRWGGQLSATAWPCQEALRGWLRGGPEVTCSTEHCPLRLPGRCCSRPGPLVTVAPAPR